MIAIANDHSALSLKAALIGVLNEMGLSFKDFGTNENTSCDYPLMAYRAAKSVASGECELGIVLCGTGIGVSMAANKVKGIRCALVSDPYCARMTREHNNANMIAMGARVVGEELAKENLKAFLNAAFEGGRHQRRIDLISRIEKGEDIE